MVKNCLLFLVFFIPFVVYCQDDGMYAHRQNYMQKDEKDTCLFHELRARFLHELSIKQCFNIDSFHYYGVAAVKEGKQCNRPEDVVAIYMDMAKGYLDKTKIEEAKAYYTLALKEAAACRNLYLQSKAYSGYGYTLVYDNSDYTGALKFVQTAYDIAGIIKDTSLMMKVTAQLVRINNLKPNGLLEGYIKSMELVKLSELRHDTHSLVEGYFLLGSIYGEMGRHDKQMQMVYQNLALKEYIVDSQALYRINYTASNGYLGTQQYDSVYYYSRLNIPIAKKIGRYPTCLENIAKAFLEQNRLDSAKHYYNEILRAKHSTVSYIDTYLYMDLGKIEFRSGGFDKALEYYKIAEAELNRPRLYTQIEILKALYEYYEHQGEEEKALDYVKRYSALEDSLGYDQASINMLELESERYRAEVSLLKKDKQLQISQAAKQDQEESMMLGALALIAVAAGWGFNRFRINRNLKNKQALLNERLRISRDLHDEVGSTLSGIAMYTHIAREQVKNADNSRAENSLTIMQKSAGEMISKLSDIVWLINPERDTISEMFQRLAEYARQMASVQNMQIRIDLPAGLSEKHIPLEARRNIYLFCKEAINNAVKYSDGTLIELQAKVVDGDLRFSVRDDGKGFDEMTIRRGNGLRNMRKRAEEIGAICKIASRPLQGANIEMQYKLIH